MITYDEVLNLNYYKKARFSGWIGGMRFLLRQETPEGEDPVFHAWVWPGPYIFDLTPAEKKLTARFPFSEDGKKQAVDWINQQYEEHGALWPKNKTGE